MPSSLPFVSAFPCVRACASCLFSAFVLLIYILLTHASAPRAARLVHGRLA